MNLQQIEQNVANVDLSQGFDLIYDLLRAYGIPKASISRLKSGTYDRSKEDNEHLWKGKVYYRFAPEDEDVHVLIDDAKRDERIMRERPRFLIVRNDQRLVAIDTKVEGTLDIAPSELPAHTAFFLPWAGIEKTQLESLNYADIKAAEKMARLYDEIVKQNSISTPEDVHDLNVFFSRLLFCFFSEDTGVFPKASFTNAIASLTKDSGEDTVAFLDTLFKVLDTGLSDRVDIPAHFAEFGYVNGKLFARRSSAPVFTAKARRVMLECGTLNWSQINPDIFGSMIQAVVHPSQREGLGMHYTSVENIMKVIRPLFLNSLDEALEDAVDSVPKLERLLERIASIKVFDPGCGSGNFLVIAYKELRKLEHKILQRLADLQRLDSSKAGLFKLPRIKLENFFGIEIDDFAHEIAILSLWLAKHQMNVEFNELFGVEISLIPLKDTGNIVCENAARVDWKAMLPPDDEGELFVLGNPPYLGTTLQSPENKADLAAAFGDRLVARNLDYVSAWFIKGAELVAQTGCHLAFVSTNSVCQGAHVGMLWPHVFREGAAISFAHTSFLWTNLAKGGAGVTCVIIGLSVNPKKRFLYSGNTRREVDNINAYLAASQRNTIVTGLNEAASELPPMVFGTRLVDGGHLILSASERRNLLAKHPEAQLYLRRFVGAQELLQGIQRWCLLIDDDQVSEAYKIEPIAARLQCVANKRRKSPEKRTRELAEYPHRYYSPTVRDAPSIIVPNHSSERRDYIPMGFLEADTVISNAASVIYDPPAWVFGLIQSRMHMVWVRAVAGRLKTDLRYSAELCYNTFPVPHLSRDARDLITKRALSVLEAREQFAQLTLGQLYDPQKMPGRRPAARGKAWQRATGRPSEARPRRRVEDWRSGRRAPGLRPPLRSRSGRPPRRRARARCGSSGGDRERPC
jgi:hypothetical protein